MRTPHIDAWLERDFGDGPDAAAASALIDTLGEGLSFWKIITGTDRVEAAALQHAAGDLERLQEAVTIALRDWRDLLVWTGNG